MGKMANFAGFLFKYDTTNTATVPHLVISFDTHVKLEADIE